MGSSNSKEEEINGGGRGEGSVALFFSVLSFILWLVTVIGFACVRWRWRDNNDQCEGKDKGSWNSGNSGKRGNSIQQRVRADCVVADDIQTCQLSATDMNIEGDACLTGCLTANRITVTEQLDIRGHLLSCPSVDIQAKNVSVCKIDIKECVSTCELKSNNATTCTLTAGSICVTDLEVTGGTRFMNLTPLSAVVTDSDGNLQTIALANGQVVVGSTGAAPMAATIIPGTGLTITDGPNSIRISDLPEMNILGTPLNPIPSGAFTPVEFAFVPGLQPVGLFDPYTFWRPLVSLSNFIVPMTGTYSYQGWIHWNDSVLGTARLLRLAINGVDQTDTEAATQIDVGGRASVINMGVRPFTAGQAVSLIAFQDTGAPLAIIAASLFITQKS